ncbi:Odorant receptor 7 [Frankliniella occidentalis]|nr:Odorant receptor 7 [Frankliniella occidentalis]
MQLSVYLSWLCLEQHPLLRVLRAVLKSRLPMTFMGLSCILEGIVALMQTTARTTLPAVSAASDFYSAYSCCVVARQPRFWNILSEVKRLVQVMEDIPGEKVWADSARRNIAVIFKSVFVTAVVMLGCILADMLLSDEPMLSLWPFVPHAGSWGLLVRSMFWGAASTVCCVTLFHVLVPLICVTTTVTAMHHALAQHLLDSTGKTPEVVRDVVRLHQQLRHETLNLVDFFATNLVHILACSFVDAVLSVLSYFSQELSDSSLALKRCAYAAATGGAVTLAEARALQLVILAASRPPALGCRGLGRLSLANAGRALRQAYSMVNVLSSKF